MTRQGILLRAVARSDASSTLLPRAEARPESLKEACAGEAVVLDHAIDVAASILRAPPSSCPRGNVGNEKKKQELEKERAENSKRHPKVWA